jgi:hypothetical protein
MEASGRTCKPISAGLLKLYRTFQVIYRSAVYLHPVTNHDTLQFTATTGCLAG